MTKEKVESHLLDTALFLDSLQERVEFYFEHLVLVKPQKLDTLVFILALLCKKRPTHSRAERMNFNLLKHILIF